jgi:hypothetical protein
MIIEQTIEIPPSHRLFLDVPPKVPAGKTIITFTTVSTSSDFDGVRQPVKHSAFGRLKANANPSLIPEEKGAWERATAEKYALH